MLCLHLFSSFFQARGVLQLLNRLRPNAIVLASVRTWHS